MEDNQVRYQRHVRLFFYCIVGGVIALLSFGLLKLLFPFALAWLAALLLQPTLGKLTKLTGFSRGTVGFLLLLLTAFVGGGLLWWLISRIATELPQLASGLANGAEQITDRFSDLANRLRAHLPFLSSMSEEKWNSLGSEVLQKGME